MLRTDVETNMGGGGGGLRENLEKLKIAFWVEGTFGGHHMLTS